LCPFEMRLIMICKTEPDVFVQLVTGG